jgi:GntR family transcriptional regulator
MNDQEPTIVFRLDSRSDRPPFRQLVDQVVGAFERGHLRKGDQLPSLREVVRQITINPNTVQRAYRELEHLGLVEGRVGLGTFVIERSGAHPVIDRSRSWRDTLREGVAQAKASEVPDDEIVDNVRVLLSSDARASS